MGTGLFGYVPPKNDIATELTKLLTFSETRALLLPFRTSGGKKVDFVAQKKATNFVAFPVVWGALEPF